MVYLVGAGPGDPELITYKGKRLLAVCDAVIYDRLIPGDLLDDLRSDCVRIYVGKETGLHSMPQEEINKVLVDAGKTYHTVVRLKGGDPFVFGRGGEEILALQEADIPFCVVPGVTSAIAVPETLGIPVTHREVSRCFQVATGHTGRGDEANLSHIHRVDGTGVYLMGLSNLQAIMERLLEEGESPGTPVAVIAHGMLLGERVVRGTVATIPELVKQTDISSPALIVVGKTAAYDLRDRRRGPLDGRKIGVTATPVMREKLRTLLTEKGASVYSVCDMQILETAEMKRLAEALKHIEGYMVVAFTSQNGVHLFFERARKLGIDYRRFASVKFAVVGDGCRQALEREGFRADYMPEHYTTEDLARKIRGYVPFGARILIPRARQGGSALKRILTEYHPDAEILSVYDVSGKKTENWRYLSDMDALLFVSASGVRAFIRGLKEDGVTDFAAYLRHICIAAIGRTTAEALVEYGIRPDVVPEQCDCVHMIAQLETAFT